MNNTRKTRIAALGVTAGLVLAISGTAQAALHDRGGGLIYDDDRNITWLADANYARTSGFDSDGLMNWVDVVGWAANLNYFDSVRNVHYDDWRLPSVQRLDDPCPGANGISSGIGCNGSDFGHLFWTEFGRGVSATPNANYFLFQNIQDLYWEQYVSSGNAGVFGTDGVNHSSFYLGPLASFETYAWAVRDGDVAAVPEADTWAMLLAGLGLVGAAARRRKQYEA